MRCPSSGAAFFCLARFAAAWALVFGTACLHAPGLVAAVSSWIDLNRGALLAYWRADLNGAARMVS